MYICIYICIYVYICVFWVILGRLGTQEAPRKHPGGTQEAPRRPETSWKQNVSKPLCFFQSKWWGRALSRARERRDHHQVRSLRTTIRGGLGVKSRARGYLIQKIHRQNPYSRDCLGKLIQTNCIFNHDTIFLVPDIWYQIYGTGKLVPEIWYPISSTRYLVPDFWHLISGTRFMVPDFWYHISGTRFLVPDFWYPISGT